MFVAAKLTHTILITASLLRLSGCVRYTMRGSTPMSSSLSNEVGRLATALRLQRLTPSEQAPYYSHLRLQPETTLEQRIESLRIELQHLRKRL